MPQTDYSKPTAKNEGKQAQDIKVIIPRKETTGGDKKIILIDQKCLQNQDKHEKNQLKERLSAQIEPLETYTCMLPNAILPSLDKSGQIQKNAQIQTAQTVQVSDVKIPKLSPLDQTQPYPIRCKQTHAQIYFSKLGNGNAGKCVKYLNTKTTPPKIEFLTPRQFEIAAGLKGGDWKRSIFCGKTSCKIENILNVNGINTHAKKCQCRNCTDGVYDKPLKPAHVVSRAIRKKEKPSKSHTFQNTFVNPHQDIKQSTIQNINNTITLQINTKPPKINKMDNHNFNDLTVLPPPYSEYSSPVPLQRTHQNIDQISPAVILGKRAGPFYSNHSDSENQFLLNKKSFTAGGVLPVGMGQENPNLGYSQPVVSHPPSLRPQNIVTLPQNVMASVPNFATPITSVMSSNPNYLTHPITTTNNFNQGSQLQSGPSPIISPLPRIDTPISGPDTSNSLADKITSKHLKPLLEKIQSEKLLHQDAIYRLENLEQDLLKLPEKISMEVQHLIAQNQGMGMTGQTSALNTSISSAGSTHNLEITSDLSDTNVMDGNIQGRTNTSMTEGMELPKCFTCKDKVSNLMCNGCSKSFYCGESCQIEDWEAGHSENCGL